MSLSECVMSAYQVNEANGHEWLSVVAGTSRFNAASGIMCFIWLTSVALKMKN